jgi:hypothetical protein
MASMRVVPSLDELKHRELGLLPSAEPGPIEELTL